jgi:hypothetical protein
MTCKLIIPNWHPTALNVLMGGHWATAYRHKMADMNLICCYCLKHRIPLAQGPRQVDLLITLKTGGRQRGCDADAYWKSTLDALVHARMLIDDKRLYCKLGDVTFDRGLERATTITLTDLYQELA